MFRGATSVSIDSKGRFSLPTRYRAEILEQNQGQMVCTVDIRQPCLLLYPLNEWEKIERSLANLSGFNPVNARLQRVMLGFATECCLDRNGRILLSPALREHIHIDKNIMLLGGLNKFEIWTEEAWNLQIQEDIQAARSEDFSQSEELKTLLL